MDPIDDWKRLLRDQGGALTCAQALARGLSPGDVRAHVAAGRWRRGPSGVLIAFNGPVPPETRRWIAVLACWPCALSHDTAGEHWRMRRPAPSAPIHVTVEYGRSTSRTGNGLVVHRSRAFDHITARTLAPPVVTAPHTAVDLAVAEPTARRGMSTLLRCGLAGGVTGGQLLAALDLRRPRRWGPALLEAARLVVDGVMSTLEAGYVLDVERAHGLPEGTRQLPVVVDGTTLFEDLLYRVRGGEMIVRLDGWRFHSDRDVALRDRRRGNAAEVAGRGRLAFGWEEVMGQPCRTAREVAAGLRRYGWGDVLRTCERCGSP